MTRRTLLAFSLVLAVGCGSDDGDVDCRVDADCAGTRTCVDGACIDDSADAGGQPDAGADTSTDPGDYCSDLPQAANVGVPCEGEADTFCGDGGTCVTPPTGGDAICAQLCFEQLCGDTCVAPLDCTGLSTSGGAPAGVDLDGDGVNDTDIGACVERPVGDVPVFGACGGGDFCMEGTDCLITESGSDRGRCYPRCDEEACADIDGVPGACVLVIDSGPGATPSHCLAQCGEAGTVDACPESFSCVSNGDVAVCVPPGL